MQFIDLQNNTPTLQFHKIQLYLSFETKSLKPKQMKTGRNALKIAVCTAIISLFTNSINAQHVEMSAFGGWATGAVMNTSSGDLHIKSSENFGGTFSVGATEEAQLEFTFNHMNTKLTLEGYGTNIVDDECDINVDYYTLGIVRSKSLGKAAPYGSLAMGLVDYHPIDVDYDSEQKFVVTLAAGVKIKTGERLGIKLQARLLLPVFYGGVYFGTSGAGISGGASMVQGDFTGGIYYTLK